MSARSLAEIKAGPGRDVMYFHEVFPARMAALTRVMALAQRVGDAAAFDRQEGLRLALILEELFTNTVTHGHGGDSDAPIDIAFDVVPGRVVVTYQDTGPRFDLAAAAGARADEAAAGPRAPGGLGLALIGRMAADLQYARAGDRNRISLTVVAAR